MTAVEVTPPEIGQRWGTPTRSDQQALFVGGDPIQVRVDSEWKILNGRERFAEFLDIDGSEMADVAIGELLHPTDVGISPTSIWNLGEPVVLRFLHRTDGYVRLSVGIARTDKGWQMTLSDVDAEIVDLRPSSR